MSITVDLDVSELDDLAAALRRAAADAGKRLTRALAMAGESAARERVTAGSPGPDGRRWPPRHPLSRSRKPLLNDQGGLNDSIESDAAGTTAQWGSNLVYARIHQEGGEVKPVRARALAFGSGRDTIFRRRAVIPPRPFLGWGAREADEADEVVARWLDQVLPGGGGK